MQRKNTLILFQFYDSPIKSSVKERTGGIIPAGFNSMIVRLKVAKAVMDVKGQKSFNSMIVRLKVSTFSVEREARLRFNSMIVRLKEKA